MGASVYGGFQEMKMKLLVLAAFITWGDLSPASATTYIYTGNNFTGAGAPFDTSESIIGTFTIPSPLTIGFNSISPSQFSFSAGLVTISSSNATSALFGFIVNSLSQITAWEINLRDSVNSHSIDSVNNLTGQFNSPIVAFDEVDILPGYPQQAFNVSDSGTFAVTAATPLPAALPLFASGLGALGLLGWRRKRKTIAA
jgi:hypothetical protein